MIVIFEFILKFLLFLLFYLYILYPFLLWIMSWFAGNKILKSDIFPKVSVVIIGVKKGADLGTKIENCLSLDYPAGKLDIVVAVNERSDELEALISGYFSKGVKLFYPAEKKTDMEVLLLTAADSSGEAVIVTDTSSMLDKYAAKNLMRNFADLRCGVASGRTISFGANNSYIKGGGIFDLYRTIVLDLISRSKCLTAVNPSLYAFKKEAYKNVPFGVANNAAVPVSALKSGYYSVFEPLAVVEKTLSGNNSLLMEEDAAGLLGKIVSVKELPAFLGILKFSAALNLLSYNLLLSASGGVLLLVLIFNIFLLGTGVSYIFMLGLQVIFYAAGATKVSGFAYYFSFYNIASIKALWRLVRSKDD